MRRLREKRSEHEKGAATILVAMLLVVLMGFAALAVDVGAMYAEKAQLQTGADSAALAIAGDCAGGACGDFNATGDLLADANSNDGSSGIASITFPNSTTVRVETNARDASTDQDNFRLYFAQVLGFSTSDIRAVAEASWGAPSAAETLPWTISQCVFEQFLTASQLAELKSTGSFTGNPDSARILFRYDKNVPAFPGCEADNGYAPGGFGWLDTDGTCSADVDTANEEVGSNPGNNFPQECLSAVPTLMDKPILIPLFTAATQKGQKTRYALSGFIAFQVTGYKFGGEGQQELTNLDPSAPDCPGGNCRGIQGYFTRYVSLEEGLSVSSGNPNYGATAVGLTK